MYVYIVNLINVRFNKLIKIISLPTDQISENKFRNRQLLSLIEILCIYTVFNHKLWVVIYEN